MNTELLIQQKRIYKSCRDKTREEILEIRDDIQDDIDTLAEEVNKAKRAAATKGEYSDPQWFENQNEILRIKRRTIQRLNELMGRKRREQNGKFSMAVIAPGNLASIFMQEAEAILPTETYDKILDCACQKLAQQGGNHEKDRNRL